MKTICVGDMVEWQPVSQPLTRGEVICLGYKEVLVEYGPWCDRAWLPVESLRVVVANPNPQRS